MCVENTTAAPCRAFPPLHTITFLAEVAGSSGDWCEETHLWKRLPVEIQGHSEQTPVSAVFSTLIKIYQLGMRS